MIWEHLIAALVATHMPVSEPRAAYLASSIVYAAGTDPDGAAAMVVNLRAETGGLEVYERCLLPEMGGWGAFGVGDIWERWYPGATCGPIDAQARAAWAVLAWHKYAPAVAFGHYIGARTVERHPEARRRAAEHWVVRWEMDHLACL